VRAFLASRIGRPISLIIAFGEPQPALYSPFVRLTLLLQITGVVSSVRSGCLGWTREKQGQKKLRLLTQVRRAPRKGAGPQRGKARPGTGSLHPVTGDAGADPPTIEGKPKRMGSTSERSHLLLSGSSQQSLSGGGKTCPEEAATVAVRQAQSATGNATVFRSRPARRVGPRPPYHAHAQFSVGELVNLSPGAGCVSRARPVR
jgi:hypothetical protein